MSKHSIDHQEQSLFRQEMQGVKKLTQDKVCFSHAVLPKHTTQVRHDNEVSNHSFYFSDSFQPNLPSEGPMRYARSDVSKYEVKRLRKGNYPPEVTLDLHGLTQQQAKQELAALINYCNKQHFACACIIHGKGKHILKTKVPEWLAQHPLVMAFHQAPLEYGGQGALLVLFEQQDPQDEQAYE